MRRVIAKFRIVNIVLNALFILSIGIISLFDPFPHASGAMFGWMKGTDFIHFIGILCVACVLFLSLLVIKVFIFGGQAIFIEFRKLYMVGVFSNQVIDIDNILSMSEWTVTRSIEIRLRDGKRTFLSVIGTNISPKDLIRIMEVEIKRN